MQMVVNRVLISCGFFLLLLAGCAEGPMWRSGYLSPRVRQQWSDEEQIAKTLFTKRSEIRELVEKSLESGASDQRQASQMLADIVQKDPILLMRIEATKLLANFNDETAVKALQLATKDRAPEVRLEAIKSWGKMGEAAGQQVLENIARNNPDTDHRIAAAAALANYTDPQAVQTLGKLLTDPNPALQLRAAESLATVTGEEFGKDIHAWLGYVGQRFETEDTLSRETQSATAKKPAGDVFR